MHETIDAIYENGLLRPLTPLPWLDEQRRVRVTVATDDRAQSLSGCVGILPDEDAQELRRIIEAEFEQVDTNEWK